MSVVTVSRESRQITAYRTQVLTDGGHRFFHQYQRIEYGGVVDIEPIRAGNSVVETSNGTVRYGGSSVVAPWYSASLSGYELNFNYFGKFSMVGVDTYQNREVYVFKKVSSDGGSIVVGETTKLFVDKKTEEIVYIDGKFGEKSMTYRVEYTDNVSVERPDWASNVTFYSMREGEEYEAVLDEGLYVNFDAKEPMLYNETAEVVVKDSDGAVVGSGDIAVGHLLSEVGGIAVTEDTGEIVPYDSDSYDEYERDLDSIIIRINRQELELDIKTVE